MDQVEAFGQVATRAQRGEGVEDLVPFACDLCQDVLPNPAWAQVRAIDWAASSEQSVRWLATLLATEPPGVRITGFWFGIFNPIYGDSARAGSDLLRQATSDFYIQGSTTYPDTEWLFDDTWQPDGRYAHSEAQDRIYRIASEQVEDEVLPIADYVLTFAHAAGTVNTLIDRVNQKLWLGLVAERGIAVGHDSGDGIFLGVLGPGGINRTGAGWI